MTDLPVGAVTFLLTDIEGSTRLWEQDREAMSSALRRHDAILRGCIEGHLGHVFRTAGDAFGAAFGDPIAALEAALAAQRQLAHEDWSAVAPGFDGLRVRMAVHTGLAQPRGSDYVGPAVRRADLLLAAGHGGQVLVSAGTVELARDVLGDSVGLRDLGEHRLRDLSRPTRVYQLAALDLQAAFPPLRTLEASPNNLPLETDHFIGRATDMARLVELVRPGRLVTLCGVGGVGKSRLARQFAAAAMERFADGVWLVELADLEDAGLVPLAVAGALGLQEEAGRSIDDALAEWLGDRAALLVLDNCEHLIDAVARLAVVLLQRCRNVAVLATSRERLAIAGEQVWRVGSLSVPDAWPEDPDAAAAAIGQSESVELFVDRATAAHHAFRLEGANAPVVAEICRRLDGIPLAIELAAARLKSMGAGEIARRLDDRFRLLTTGSRTGLPHHRTLLAAIDWSHDLLSAPGQALLCRLAVFRGGWTLEAAEHVLAGSDADRWGVVDQLSQLIDHSLVEMSSEGEGRYRLLESVRAYAAEKLAQRPDAAATMRAHGDWYRAFALRAEPELLGPEQAQWLDRLERDHDNFRAVLDRALRSGEAESGLDLAAALWRFWWLRGHCREGRSRLRALLETPGSTEAPHRAAALHAAGTLAIYLDDLAAARRDLDAAIEAWWELGDEAGEARTQNNLGIVAEEQGDYAAARELYTRAMEVWDRRGDERMASILIGNLGCLATIRGDLAEATERLRRCLPLMRRLGNLSGTADTLFHLGYAAQLQGRRDEAQAFYDQCLGLRTVLEDRLGIGEARRNMAEMALDVGEIESARAVLGECLQLVRAAGDLESEAETLDDLAMAAYLDGRDEEAEELLGEALAMHERVGHRRGASDSLDLLARVLARRAEVVPALRHLARSMRLRREMGHWLARVTSLETCAIVEARSGMPDLAALAGQHARAAEAERLRVGAPLAPMRARDLLQALGAEAQEGQGEACQEGPGEPALPEAFERALAEVEAALAAVDQGSETSSVSE